MKEIEQLEEKNRSLKEKAMALQRKLAQSSKEDFIDEIKIKINAFFTKKLGRKNMYILKEFNEKVMDIVAPSHNSSQNFAELMKSFSSVHASAEAESDASKRRAANKYEHLMKDSENRSERMSE